MLYHVFFYIMKVSHLTMRTYGVNQALRLVKGNWYIERVVKSEIYFGEDLVYIIRVQHVMSYHLT